MSGVLEAAGPVQFAVLDLASGSNEVVAAQSGYKIRVLQFKLVAAATQTVRFLSAATGITGTVSLANNQELAGEFSPVGHFETAAGEALNCTTSASTADGWLAYQLVKASP